MDVDDETVGAPRTASLEGEPAERLSTTTMLSLAAVGAAVLAMFGEGDSTSPITVGAALASLLPWALEAGGVRVHPLVFTGVTIGASAAIVVIDGNLGGTFIAILAIVWVTRRCGPSPIVVGTVVVSVLLVVIHALVVEPDDEGGTFYFLGGVGVSTLCGAMLRRQEQLGLELRAMNQLQIEHAAAAERTRIAREVHDVVAHSLTVVMLHVGGARRALASDRDGAAAALERAETVGRESLDSIRQVVGLLRSGSAPDDALGVVQKSVDDIDELVDGYRVAGVDVELRVDVRSELVDAPTGLTVYRLVQEGLSNAVRHAAGAPCRVSLEVVGVDLPGDASGHVLEVAVVNGRSIPATATGVPPGRRDGPVGRRADGRSRLGVRGMTERVRALGGSIEVGPTSEGWQVVARLPLPGSRSSCRPSPTSTSRPRCRTATWACSRWPRTDPTWC